MTGATRLTRSCVLPHSRPLAESLSIAVGDRAHGWELSDAYCEMGGGSRDRFFRWLRRLGCAGPLGFERRASGNAAATPGPSGEIPSDPIGRVVYDFLESVRVGQGENAAAKLLTPLALQKIQEQDLNIAPPGSPTARFKVTHVEMMEGDRAVVDSTWTDVDADGKHVPGADLLRAADLRRPVADPRHGPVHGRRSAADGDRLRKSRRADRTAASARRTSQRINWSRRLAEQPAASVATDPFNQPAQR